MAATVYMLTGKQGRDLFRLLSVSLSAGTIVDADFSFTLWPRHDPEHPIVDAGTVSIVDTETGTVQLHVPAAVVTALDPNRIYAYQIDGTAQDNTRETIAQGRFYVEAALTEA